MKKNFLLLTLMLVGIVPALAQKKVIYAEISLNYPYTITFKAVDAGSVPEENASNGIYSLSTERPSYTEGTKVQMGRQEIEMPSIGTRVTKAVFDPSVADARPSSTSYWFYNMPNLTTVEGINYLNTSEVANMAYMFTNDNKLETLDVSGFDTQNVILMTSMFSGCSSLTNLNVANFNTANVTDMSSMFKDCSSLTNLNVANFNTANVFNMNSMFSGCSKVTNLEVSKFDTKKVTNMASMFSGCSSLSNLNVANFNTTNVTDMSSMFSKCSSLTNLNVANFNTANVINMNSMFSGCSKVTSLEVSKFDTKKVTNMASMFSDCSSLSNLNVANFNTANVTDMSSMFKDCSSLTSLDVTKFTTANVTDMSSTFSGCSSLTSLDVTKFNTANVTNMNSMFFYCSSLTSLDVTKFTTANVTNMSSMFCGCSSLKALDMPNFTTTNVTDMNSMFKNCTSLSSLDVSKFDTEKVKNMSSMFASCQSLNSLDVSNFKTKNVTSMSYMFESCSSLTSLDISKWDISGISSLIGFANSCWRLTKLNLGGNDISAKATKGGRENFQFSLVGTPAHPCFIYFTFDKSNLGKVEIDKMNPYPPYYNYWGGFFTIADELNCSKDPAVCTAEEYKPVAKANTDLWQSNRALTTNQWNTLVVPVALTFEQLQQSFGSEVEVCRLESYSGKTIYFKSVKSGDIIEANVPVLVRPHEDIRNIGYADVTIEVPTNSLSTTSAPSEDGKTATFIGSYKRYMQLTSKDDFYFSPSRGFFIRSNGNAHIGNTRAYFRLSDHPTTALTLKIDDSGISTNIDSIDGEAIGHPEGPVYNLSGQRVGDDYKGIVIVNGKKVLRK